MTTGRADIRSRRTITAGRANRLRIHPDSKNACPPELACVWNSIRALSRARACQCGRLSAAGRCPGIPAPLE
eukprot:5121303-Pyramimonas_sp.AAC.1